MNDVTGAWAAPTAPQERVTPCRSVAEGHRRAPVQAVDAMGLGGAARLHRYNG